MSRSAKRLALIRSATRQPEADQRLLNVEFVDEQGVTRRLTRDELFIYLNVVAGAGNDTTTRLIGWAAAARDAHVGNTYLVPDGKDCTVGFLDWQVARRGSFALDLG